MPLRVIEGKFKKGVVTLKKVPKDIEESEIVVIFTREKKWKKKDAKWFKRGTSECERHAGRKTTQKKCKRLVRWVIGYILPGNLRKILKGWAENIAD